MSHTEHVDCEMVPIPTALNRRARQLVVDSWGDSPSEADSYTNPSAPARRRLPDHIKIHEERVRLGLQEKIILEDDEMVERWKKHGR